VQVVDKEVGVLWDEIAKLNMPVDVIVLSDHGMAKVQGEWITLEQYFPDGTAFEKITLPGLYARSEGDAQRAYESLRGKSDKFAVYRRAQTPPGLHDEGNPRSGDPIIVTNGPYLVRFSADGQATASSAMTPNARRDEVGAHGFDPARVPEVKASFFAAGPDIRSGVTLEPFENVNVYPLVAKLLGLDFSHLKTGAIDGDLRVLAPILKESAEKSKAKAAAPAH
jgi:alkaline phosphatase D